MFEIITNFAHLLIYLCIQRLLWYRKFKLGKIFFNQIISYRIISHLQYITQSNHTPNSIHHDCHPNKFIGRYARYLTFTDELLLCCMLLDCTDVRRDWYVDAQGKENYFITNRKIMYQFCIIIKVEPSNKKKVFARIPIPQSLRTDNFTHNLGKC